MRGGQLLAALLERPLAVGGDQALAGFNQIRQRRFGIRGDRDIDFGVALEILIVALDVQVARRDADHLRARLGDRLARSGATDRGYELMVPQRSGTSRPTITSALPMSPRPPA